MQVVPRHQAQTENFVGPEQMSDIGSRELAAGVTPAALFQWPEIFAVSSVFDGVRSTCGKYRSIPRHARR